MLDALLVLALAAYAIAATRANASLSSVGAARRARSEFLAFVAGAAALLVAVAGPIDAVADRSLTGHMVQHLLLLFVVAPAFVAAHPARTLPRLPLLRDAHRRLRRARPGAAPLAAGAVAFFLASLTVWHVPGPYELALHHDAVHALEHVSLVVASMALWSVALVAATRRAFALAFFSLFPASIVCTAVGAALVVARRPWYDTYIDHAGVPAALDDQRLAGMVMWGFGNLLLVVVAAALVGPAVARSWRRLAAPAHSNTPVGGVRR